MVIRSEKEYKNALGRAWCLTVAYSHGIYLGAVGEWHHGATYSWCRYASIAVYLRLCTYLEGLSHSPNPVSLSKDLD